MIRVFILADDQERARGLADLLAEEDRFEIVGWEVAGGPGVRSGPGIGSVPNPNASVPNPDVALLSGNVALSELPFADVPIVLLSGDWTEPDLEVWNPHGPVRASLSEQASPADIVAALLSASQGFTVLTPLQAEAVFQASGDPIPVPRNISDTLIEQLTPRELQVLRMVAEGKGNKEIACQLGISGHTAKFHVASILGKLHSQTRTEAVARGIRLGLVPI